MRVLLEAVAIVGVALAAGGLTKIWHPRAPALYLQNEPLARNEVTLEEVGERWSGEVIWIDARSRAEYEKGHHPGALLLNEEEWTDLLLQHEEILFGSETPVVVYCAARVCEASRKVTERLRQNTPREEVYFLRGGWKVLKDAE